MNLMKVLGGVAAVGAVAALAWALYEEQRWEDPKAKALRDLADARIGLLESLVKMQQWLEEQRAIREAEENPDLSQAENVSNMISTEFLEGVLAARRNDVAGSAAHFAVTLALIGLPGRPRHEALVRGWVGNEILALARRFADSAREVLQEAQMTRYGRPILLEDVPPHLDGNRNL